jgi:hypothetical protein
MVHIKPATTEASAAIIRAASDGPKIYKDDLYIHAARQAIALSHGYTTWDDYLNNRQAQAVKWLESFKP